MEKDKSMLDKTIAICLHMHSAPLPLSRICRVNSLLCDIIIILPTICIRVSVIDENVLPKGFVATIVLPFCVLNYNCDCDDLTRTIDNAHYLPPDPLSGFRTDTFEYNNRVSNQQFA